MQISMLLIILDIYNYVVAKLTLQEPLFYDSNILIPIRYLLQSWIIQDLNHNHINNIYIVAHSRSK